MRSLFQIDFIIASCGFFLGAVVTYFFLYHGIVDGLIKKKIIGDYNGNYLEGKYAVIQGIILIVFGVIGAAGVIIIGISLYMNIF